MFIAHLPAGYLAAKAIEKRFNREDAVPAVLLGSIAPDLDLIYFYTWGEQAVNHHHYPTHQPLYWVAVAGLYFVLVTLAARKDLYFHGAMIFLGIFLHMVMDSYINGIFWLAPFSDFSIGNFIHVPRLYEPWYWNFIFHWSILPELVIVGAAIYIWRRGKTPQKSSKEAP